MSRFAADIKRFVKLSREKADVATRRITLGILANVITSSPVDTGRFRGNWRVGIGTRVASADAPAERNPGAVIEREGANVPATAGHLLFISNNLPYARRLEYGWSRQAPKGMVRLTFRSLGKIVGEALK